MSDGRTRCEWAAGGDALMLDYHDREWGVPVHDDRTHFELLILEGAQAGLSWRTVLGRREGYRAAFAGFDPEAVARFGEADRERLLQDAGIIRNRAKIASAVRNAAAFLDVQAQHGSFDAYVWAFVDGAPRRNAFGSLSELPAQTEAVEGAEPRSPVARVQLRGPDDLLRLHAGGRPGERPRHELLPPARGLSAPLSRSRRRRARRGQGRRRSRVRRSPSSARCPPRGRGRSGSAAGPSGSAPRR